MSVFRAVCTAIPHWCWSLLVFHRVVVALSRGPLCLRHQEKASCLRCQVCGSFHWKILFSSSSFRIWRRPTVTPRLPLTTLCSCLITKEMVPKLLVWAPWTPQSQTGTRTMTTWMNGATASRSWRICMEVALMTRGLKADEERDGSPYSCAGKCRNNFSGGLSAPRMWDAYLGKRPISDAARVVIISTL